MKKNEMKIGFKIKIYMCGTNNNSKREREKEKEKLKTWQNERDWHMRVERMEKMFFFYNKSPE